MSIFHVLWINPEPWAVGSVTAGRKNGKTFGRVSPNPNLVAFQQAVKEELAHVDPLPDDHRRLTFYFWRNQATYLDSADRRRHRNQADATNMQKALEDALQGILFENDRDIVDIRSVIVAQGSKVEPCIVIKAEPVIDALNDSELTNFLYEQFRNEITQSDNSWPPR